MRVLAGVEHAGKLIEGQPFIVMIVLGPGTQQECRGDIGIREAGTRPAESTRKPSRDASLDRDCLTPVRDAS